MFIGQHKIEPPLVLAPMAGITDKPMRRLCRELGAGYAVSEMVASDPRLRQTRKSQRRRDHSGERGPIGVQIAGSEPSQLADAARFNVDLGAEIIDINMGCPAKKVLKRWAGSALLQDERLVGRILDAVVAAVAVPVTLKIRTGWHREHRNGVAIARIAEDSGVAAIAVHGRTRDQRFEGSAEYETIARIKQSVSIPVIANGDIDSVEQARYVLAQTGADGLMIGRCARGRPWIFREIAAGRPLEPGIDERRAILREHLSGLYSLYGASQGVRVARKHVGWYLGDHPLAPSYRSLINQADTENEQLRLVDEALDAFADSDTRPLSVAA